MDTDINNNEVVVPTIFGYKSDRDDFFRKSVLELINEDYFRQNVFVDNGVISGPFCFTPWEKELPF